MSLYLKFKSFFDDIIDKAFTNNEYGTKSIDFEESIFAAIKIEDNVVNNKNVKAYQIGFINNMLNHSQYKILICINLKNKIYFIVDDDFNLLNCSIRLHMTIHHDVEIQEFYENNIEDGLQTKCISGKYNSVMLNSDRVSYVIYTYPNALYSIGMNCGLKSKYCYSLFKLKIIYHDINICFDIKDFHTFYHVLSNIKCDKNVQIMKDIIVSMIKPKKYHNEKDIKNLSYILNDDYTLYFSNIVESKNKKQYVRKIKLSKSKITDDDKNTILAFDFSSITQRKNRDIAFYMMREILRGEHDIEYYENNGYSVIDHQHGKIVYNHNNGQYLIFVKTLFGYAISRILNINKKSKEYKYVRELEKYLQLISNLSN